MKRVFTLLLALLMCMSALFGCSKEEEAVTENTAELVIDEGDGIGAYDFNGADFTILCREETGYEHIGDMEGTSINQKV